MQSWIFMTLKRGLLKTMWEKEKMLNPILMIVKYYLDKKILKNKKKNATFQQIFLFGWVENIVEIGKKE